MKSLWWAFSAGLVGLGILCATPTAAQEPHIPTAQGTTLAGTAVKLPDAFKGKGGVLVLGFSKGSQPQVAAWGSRLAKDVGATGAAEYFEIAMLAGAPRILRGMIVHEMGSSIPEGQRGHFLPLTENETAWRAVVRYAKADDAYVLVVDGAGVVRWQAEGDASDAAYSEMRRRLDGLAGVALH